MFSCIFQYSGIFERNWIFKIIWLPQFLNSGHPVIRKKFLSPWVGFSIICVLLIVSIEAILYTMKLYFYNCSSISTGEVKDMSHSSWGPAQCQHGLNENQAGPTPQVGCVWKCVIEMRRNDQLVCSVFNLHNNALDKKKLGFWVMSWCFWWEQWGEAWIALVLYIHPLMAMLVSNLYSHWNLVFLNCRRRKRDQQVKYPSDV